MRERLAEFEFDQRDGIVIATVAGEVDSSNASELRLALSDRLPSAARALVLDLSGVSYLDSSGIQLVFELGRRLSARRQMMRLVVPPGAPMRRVLELCDVRATAPMDAAIDESVRAISDAAASEG